MAARQNVSARSRKVSACTQDSDIPTATHPCFLGRAHALTKKNSVRPEDEWEIKDGGL